MFSRSLALKQLGYLEVFARLSASRLAAEGWGSDWKALIAILLSARTRDEVTIRVCEKLFSRYSSLEELSHASLSTLEKVLRPVNFFRSKARSVAGCSRMLVNDFGGVVPRDFEKLITLPGVGRKTANVFLSEFGIPSIGVDTHVFRLSRKLGWSKGSTPERVEEDLKRLFPRSSWSRINRVLVSFGRTFRREEDHIMMTARKL